jgi:hypothetical protein
MDHTVQLKVFARDADEPFFWLEWRNVRPAIFGTIKKLLNENAGEPMDRSGD